MSSAANGEWTDSLAEPIASILRGGPWKRVDELRDGSWVALADEGEGDGTCWYRLDLDAATATPFSLEDDRYLKRVHALCAAWMRRGLRVRLLAHRVGSRAVFRVEGSAGSFLGKAFRKDRDVALRWGVPGSSPDGAWSTPRVLGWDAESRLLEVEWCEGVSLHQRWRAGDGEEADGERIAGVLQWLSCVTVPSDLPRHTVADEERILRERLEQFERHLARPPAAAAPLVDRVVASLTQNTTAAPVLAHRDFHDKQLLLQGNRGVLIDLDLVAAAPPQLDRGNILAHLRLRDLQGFAIPWREIARRVTAPALEAGSGRELAAWTAATFMRLALIYSRRRRAPELLGRLLEETGCALEGRGDWEGIL